MKPPTARVNAERVTALVEKSANKAHGGIITRSADRKVKPDFAQYEFAYQDGLIMACIGGSQAHGAKLGATDDTDWYGLYIPPPIRMLGLDREEHLFSPRAERLAGMGRRT
jgi:hypothetical protein